MQDNSTTDLQEVDALALAVVPAREIELTKVKLDKFYNLYAEYTLRENGVSSEITRKVHQPAHEDLVAAFKKLTVHLCLMTEVVSGIRWEEDQFLQDGALMTAFQDESIYSAAEFDSYRCTGLTLVSGGVVLIGQKKLRSKKVLNLVSPFEVFEPETPTGDEYYHLDYLDGDVQHAIEEVRAYLDGKYSDDGRQLDMFEEVPEVGSAETKGLAKEVNKLVHFMDEVAAKGKMTVTVSSSIDGHQNKRTFGGKELDSE